VGTQLRVHIFAMGMTPKPKLFALLLVATASGPAWAQIQPLDVPGIQSQYNAIIQQQNLGTQLNSLQLQQNLAQDRIRELDLFRPQTPFGATSVFQPQPPGLAPTPALPPPPPKPAPKAE
jgi:hypothetical protein